MSDDAPVELKVDWGSGESWSTFVLRDSPDYETLGVVQTYNGDHLIYIHVPHNRYYEYRMEENYWREILWKDVPKQIREASGGGPVRMILDSAVNESNRQERMQEELQRQMSLSRSRVEIYQQAIEHGILTRQQVLDALLPEEPVARVSVPDLSAIEQVGNMAAEMVRSMGGEDPAQSRQVQEIEEQEWEVATRTQTARRRRTTVPGRANISGPTTKNPPIFVWGMQSSIPRNGGQYIQYEVRLNDDGSLSCNCPGWIFKKNTATRGCKHTRHPEVVKDAKDFFERHGNGEQLPVLAPTQEQVDRARSTKDGQKAVQAGKDPMEGFGRFIDLEE